MAWRLDELVGKACGEKRDGKGNDGGERRDQKKERRTEEDESAQGNGRNPLMKKKNPQTNRALCILRQELAQSGCGCRFRGPIEGPLATFFEVAFFLATEDDEIVRSRRVSLFTIE